MERIILPKMGQAIEKARIIKWLKRENEPVKKGEVLFEIETDKADLEVQGQTDGVLRKILHGEGETLPVLTVVGYVGRPDEPLPQEAVSGPATPERKTAASQAAATPPAGMGKVIASPAARRVARERGIDLATINGSGPGGRITMEDVKAASAGPAAPGVAEVFADAAGDAPDVGVAGEVRPVEGARKIIAERMLASKLTAPHYYLSVDVDMSAAVALRKEMLPVIQSQNGSKLSYNDILIKASAVALREIPMVNAVWKGDTVHLLRAIHVGLAVNLRRGLIVPVVRNADKLSLAEISAATDDLIGRARTKRLKPAEMSGSTFTVSNLGGLGIDRFVAVINPPEAAILAVGVIKEQPTAFSGLIGIRPILTATASFDHRIIDGAVGARFLSRLKQILEAPRAVL